jgi:uncharacterized protein (TIGR02118 family)
MVKLTVLYGHPDDPDAFEDYYADTRMPMVRKIPDLLRYEAAEAVATPDGSEDGSAPPYYRVFEGYFQDMERLQGSMSSSEGQRRRPSATRSRGRYPVVLVHGLSGSTRWWDRNVPDLAKHYRVYLVNLPGFGSFRRRAQRFVLAEATSWLHSWMEAVGLEEAHLVGHSMGGYLSLKLAAWRPETVRKLVLVDPAGMPSGRTMIGHLGPLLLSARYARPTFLPVLVRDALYAGPFTLWRTARGPARRRRAR